jgi:DNA-binding GntR family transcriptional regulator
MNISHSNKVSVKKMNLQKAESLRDQAYNALKKALFNGYFKPGERITEEGVAELLGVSRTPVRESLNLLGKQGILEARKGGGFIFPSPSLQEIENVFEVRRLLEPYAARKAIKFCTGADIDLLNTAIAKEIDALDTVDTSIYFQFNMEFRQKLFSMCGNEHLARAIHEFMDHMHFIGIVTLKNIAVRKIIIEGQKKIVAALIARDSRGIEKVVKSHLNAAYEAVISEVKKNLE